MFALLLLIACPNQPTVLQIGTLYEAPCPLGEEECEDQVFLGCDTDVPGCDGLVDISHCAPGRRDGHEYLFCQDPQPREDASNFCRSLGMSLVVVGDAYEADWIVESADEATVGNPWIGLVRSRGSGRWFWENGETLHYTEWDRYEPNNAGGDEACAEFYLDGMSDGLLGAWNDTDCSQLRNPICETW
jgi:hypothetical protein